MELPFQVGLCDTIKGDVRFSSAPFPMEINSLSLDSFLEFHLVRSLQTSLEGIRGQKIV